MASEFNRIMTSISGKKRTAKDADDGQPVTKHHKADAMAASSSTSSATSTSAPVVWKRLGDYEFSGNGQVRNVKTTNLISTHTKRGQVTFTGADRSMCSLARSVCEAFHGEPPQKDACVVHLDGDLANNKPGNLRWGSRSDTVKVSKRKPFKRAVRQLTGIENRDGQSHLGQSKCTGGDDDGI